jgi:dihydroorotate dehydrogenase electron transfer subunit
MFEQHAEIMEHREVLPGTHLLTLREPGIARSARPGQFVMLKTGDGLDPLLRRPFSICGSIQEDAFLLLYRVVGRGTKGLARRSSAEPLRVLGPLGNGFQYRRASPPLLLVGGGIGLAPLFFLAQTLSQEAGGQPAAFLAGFSTAGEVLESGIVPGAKGMEIATDDGSAGHCGPVTGLLEARLQDRDPAGRAGTVFACGPSAMLKKVAEISARAGVDCQVSLEAAMACGLGACLGCAVKAAEGGDAAYLRVCREGPVVPAGAVDWGAV